MKRKNRSIRILFIMLFLTALLFGCNNEERGNHDPEAQVWEQIPETLAPDRSIIPLPTAEPTAAPAPTEVPGITTQPTAQPSKTGDKLQEIRDIPSSELVKEKKIGWNLGNTMDATGGEGIHSELSWGNPFTTKEMIDTVKAAGFNTLRIPTTWEKHLGPAPDYLIDKAWLDRVQELIDYAAENDMFVILNLHHEEWYQPFYDNEEKAADMLAKVWKQIADALKIMRNT